METFDVGIAERWSDLISEKFAELLEKSNELHNFMMFLAQSRAIERTVGNHTTQIWHLYPLLKSVLNLMSSSVEETSEDAKNLLEIIYHGLGEILNK